MEVPFTEQRHPASEQIDVASPQEIATLMFREDEIFTGWDKSLGLLNEDVLQTIAKIQDKVSEMLQDCENNAVVLAGCGTSGRFAFMTAKAMNSCLEMENKSPCFRYLMAGNDIALFTSQEGYEDNPTLGQEQLEKVSAGVKHVLYVGITCGLSAPYVAGQLDLCMKHPDKYTPVLIGFNPVHMGRNLPIEGWDKTFLEVAKSMEHEVGKGRAFILNPVVGPELITGSSRMKAGTATKVLLDTIFSISHQMAPHADILALNRKVVNAYRCALHGLHGNRNDEIMGHMIEMAACSLQNGGHVYYLGDETLGLVGMIDASECPPTYGSSLEDVRGFIEGGFTSLRNIDGDMSDKFPIDVEYFTSSLLPQTTPSDLVIVVSRDGDLGFVPALERFSCRTILFNIHSSAQALGDNVTSSFECCLQVDIGPCLTGLPSQYIDAMRTSLVEVTAKWFCNTLSTGAHVRIGKVYQNLMVDVNVSNNKLFHRAVRIIQMLVGCERDFAQKLILQSIYQSDDPGPERSISKHLEVSATRSKVVPLALVIGLASCTVAEASDYLQKFPLVRRAIAEISKR